MRIRTICRMIIGFDDTDSKTAGMCTTYLGALMVEEIPLPADQVTPYLLRLNPNVRFKTRGNAAVSLRFELGRKETDEMWRICCDLLEEFAVFDDENTNPGIVFLSEEQASGLRGELEAFSLRAVRDFITIDETKKFLKKHNIKHRGYKNGRGLIGALAAASFAFNGLIDWTYEFIAYRKPENWEEKRSLDEETVWTADTASYPRTWDTVDHQNNQIVFSPHGPDPVLFGIRGSDQSAIKDAFTIVRSEPIDRYLMYTTNQGTDMHITKTNIADAKEGRSYKIGGRVTAPPHTIRGGHVIFTIEDGSERVDCAAYEPTKNFRDLIRRLAVGDLVTVYGAFMDRTVNLEKIRIDSLRPRMVVRNPRCGCGKRMKSAGKNQGYRCKKCRTKSDLPEIVETDPGITVGVYETPPVARRHLAKPLIRCNSEKKNIYPSR